MKKIYIKEKRRDVIRTRGLCVPKKVHAPKKTYPSVFTFGVHPSLCVACDPCQCSFVFLCKECRRKCFKQTRKIPEHMDIMYNLYMEVSTAFQLTLVTTVLSSLTAYIVWRFVIYVLQTTPGTFLKLYGIHYLTFCWNFVGTYFFSILGTLPFFSPKIFPTSKSSSKK